MAQKITLREKLGLLIYHYVGRHLPRKKRGFDAADTGRLLADWITSSSSMDAEMRGSLTTLRARSRQVCFNNDYGRKFMELLKTNIVGPAGIKLQAKTRDWVNGREVLDQEANRKIEEAWRDWSKKTNCTVDRKSSLTDVLNIAVTSVARDGEFLVRMVRGFDNPYGFALQLIEADHLDEKLNDERRNIRMGVERNAWNEPIAYHILTKHPGDTIYPAVYGQKHERVPADQILHIYVMTRAGQTRGLPWTTTALPRLHMIGKYEQTEFVAARVGAAKMGFFVNPSGVDYPGDDKDEEGNLIMEVAPGKFEQLPMGYDFKPFDPDHPSTAFEAFVKSVLKGAASGLNVQYSSLSSDLREANYGSLRQGLLEERDVWMSLQRFFVEHLLAEIYPEWLDWAILTGRLDLPPRKRDKWLRIQWQGRRWTWIDPQKDMTANEKAVRMRIKSRTRLAAEAGEDIEDVFEDLAREKSLAEQFEVPLEPDEKTTGGEA